MAHKTLDRTKENTSAGGLGAFALAGVTAPDMEPFGERLAVGDTTHYCAANGTDYEIGLGTYAAGNTLQRTTILRSSNGNNLVNFTSAPTVFGTVPSTVFDAMQTAPAFRAYLTAAQENWPQGAYQKVPFNAEVFDSANVFDTATGRFTPTVAGYYQFNWLALGSGTSGTVEVSAKLYKNGAANSEGSFNSSNGSNARSVGSDVVYMNGSTDYVELWVYVFSTNGAGTRSVGGGIADTMLSGHLIAASSASGGRSLDVFHARLPAVQALAAGWQKVPLSVTSINSNGSFDTANRRFKPAIAGYYMLTGMVQYQNASDIAAGLYKNGVIYVQGSYGSSDYAQTVSALVYLNGSTDYVELWAYSAAANTLHADGDAFNYLSGVLISAVQAAPTSGPAFTAFAAGAQALAVAAWTKVNFGTEGFDTAGVYDAAASRFQPNIPGYYQIDAAVHTQSVVAACASIFKNGANYKQGSYSSGNGSQVGGLVYLNGSTDYVEIHCYAQAGSDTMSSGGWTHFSAFLARLA